MWCLLNIHRISTSVLVSSFVKILLKADQSKKILFDIQLPKSLMRKCYAKESSPSDDAARVVVRIRGTRYDGNEFACIARTSGMSCIGTCSTLFDILAERSQAESRALPGRSFICQGNRVSTKLFCSLVWKLLKKRLFLVSHWHEKRPCIEV